MSEEPRVYIFNNSSEVHMYYYAIGLRYVQVFFFITKPSEECFVNASKGKMISVERFPDFLNTISYIEAKYFEDPNDEDFTKLIISDSLEAVAKDWMNKKTNFCLVISTTNSELHQVMREIDERIVPGMKGHHITAPDKTCLLLLSVRTFTDFKWSK